MPLSVEHISTREAQALYACRLCLVRPDGHVAWRGDRDPENAGAIIDTVRGAGSDGIRTNADAFADTNLSAA